MPKGQQRSLYKRAAMTSMISILIRLRLCGGTIAWHAFLACRCISTCTHCMHFLCLCGWLEMAAFFQQSHLGQPQLLPNRAGWPMATFALPHITLPIRDGHERTHVKHAGLPAQLLVYA